MRKIILALLLFSSIFLTACPWEAQLEHEEATTHESSYASENYRALNLSKSPALEAFEKQTGKEIGSTTAKTASEKYYEEHPDRRYSNPYSTTEPHEASAQKPVEETNDAPFEQEKAGTGWRGLSFAEYIISFLLTLLVYGVFPFSFSRLREKPIAPRKYRILCYAVNLLGVAFFVFLNGKSNSAAYVIWTSVFAYNGVQHLSKKGLIIQPVQAKN